MKKNIFFISLLLLSFVLAPNAFAGPTFGMSDLTSTYAVFVSSGLAPNANFILSTRDLDANAVFVNTDLTSTSDGHLVGTVSNLSQNGHYRATLLDNSWNPVAPAIDFFPSKLTFSNLTETSVKLITTDLFPNEDYRFHVSDASETNLTYSENYEFNSGSTASGERTFAGLAPGHAYEAEVSYSSVTAKTITFTTLGTPVTPPGDEQQNNQTTTSGPSNLVPCGTNVQNGKITNMCKFKDLITLVNNFVNFILFKLAIPIAAIMFIYAGFLMVTSGGNTETASKAKHIFTGVALGLVFAAAAWLIIKLILTVLGYDGSWIGF